MTHDAKLARRLAEAAETIAAAPNEALTAERICELAVDLIPACDHASITVRHRSSYTTLAATSDLAAALDAAQYDMNQGPCVDAAESEEPVVSDDVATEPRWPQWAPHAHREGVGSFMAVPLMRETTKVGAMNFYSHSAGPWSDDDVEVACLYAIHASAALAAAHQIDGLKTAMGSRHRIGLAQGVLMNRYNLTPEAAFAVLHRTSNEENRKLTDVVETVLAEPDSLS